MTPLLARVYTETGGADLAKQLRWLVEEFAAWNPTTSAPDTRAALRERLTGFLRRGLSVLNGVPEWVDDEILDQAHAAVRRILAEWIPTRQVSATVPTIEVRVTVGTYPPSHPAAGRPYVDASPTRDDDEVEAFVLRLLYLLGTEGHRVQTCGAQAPRATTLCGRLFVSRPNTRYCSRACYNRAATRRFRDKRKGIARSYGTRIATNIATLAGGAGNGVG